QINLILLALILTDIWRVAQGRDAGIGVGIAAAIKLTPGIFILFFLLAGRIKAAVIAAGTFVVCGLIGFAVAPRASKLYWEHLFFDTKRVGAPYISNQSPYAAAIRIAQGAAHIGSWWAVIPIAFAAIGLATATILVRHDDWLGATAVTGTTGLLVSPISWAHHWVWVLPALVWLGRRGRPDRRADLPGLHGQAGVPPAAAGPGLGRDTTDRSARPKREMTLRTSRTLPVMSLAASDSRNATRWATSAASPKRRRVTVSVRLTRFLSGKITVMSWFSGPGVT